MAGYVKLFGSILQSTVWETPATTRCVWITMLAMSDMDGVVSASVPGLARMAGVTRAECETALTAFLAPDPDSRTKEYEGRRIEEVDGGWRLLNHAKYRDKLRSAEPAHPGVKSDTNGRVYFIKCGDAIKIGFSQNPWARLAALRTGTPVEPVLLGHMPGTLSDERQVQKRFEASKKNREWFNDTAELRTFIEANCDKGKQAGSYGSAATGTTSELSQLPATTTIRSESGSLSLGSSSGLPGNPAGARSNEGANPAPSGTWLGVPTEPAQGVNESRPALRELPPGPITGYALRKLFGAIRARDVGGYEWQGVASANGKESSMAEVLNEDPSARADVAPTMALLFRRAQEGRAGPRSAELLAEPALAFGAWISAWTSLREELHGKAPKIPAAAKPAPPGEEPWKARQREEEQRKGTARAAARLAQEQLNRELEGVTTGKAAAG